MNSTTGQGNPRGESVESIIHRVDTTETDEQKRATLRLALAEHPGEARLLQALKDLATMDHLAEAAGRGAFVCYERSGEVFAIELADDLRAEGVDVWLDTQNIPDDGDWHHEIERALFRCGLMLLVITPDMLDDADAASEWQTFMASGKLILPVIYETCDIAALQLELPPVSFAYSYPVGLRTLLRALKTAAQA